MDLKMCLAFLLKKLRPRLFDLPLSSLGFEKFTTTEKEPYRRSLEMMVERT